ncbi:hypothetical protein RFF05_14195 [Bengtsoniella intestinalis]|uniref:hypothetical protein n=1 Tax=Bengtsoniella intestinalis TaxID=3073143 RepID=UPI00391FB05D
MARKKADPLENQAQQTPEIPETTETTPEWEPTLIEDAPKSPIAPDFPDLTQPNTLDPMEEITFTSVDTEDTEEAGIIPYGEETEIASPSIPKAETVMLEEEYEEDISNRQAFFDLKFNEIDRELTPEEQQEWRNIYASFRGRSVMTGTIIGVDKLTTGYGANQKVMYCAVVVPFRVKVVIPDTEMFDAGLERPDYVIRNMVGATIDFIITKVDREGNFALASRRRALASRRYFFNHRPRIHSVGNRVPCHILAVGPRRAFVSCYGYDMDITQRDLRYTAIPDLRDEYRPGQVIECVITSFDLENEKLTLSGKAATSNPYYGAEDRHPVGCIRQAVISGKYGGGVFCNLPDDTVCMCSYSFHYEDGEFFVGDTVMLTIRRYEDEREQIFGKIVSKL